MIRRIALAYLVSACAAPSAPPTRIELHTKHTGTWERGGAHCPYAGDGIDLVFTIADGVPTLDVRPGYECWTFPDTSEISITCRGYVDREPIANFEEFTARVFSVDEARGFVYWRTDWLEWMECVQLFDVVEIEVER